VPIVIVTHPAKEKDMHEALATLDPTIEDDDDVDELERFPEEVLPLEGRIDSFAEVDLGFKKLNAMAEAMRCLHCDRR